MDRFSFNFKYDNIPDKFEYEHSRAKVKIKVAIIRKHCPHSCTFVYGPILMYNVTSYKNLVRLYLDQVKVSAVKGKGQRMVIFRKMLLALLCFH